MTKSKHNKKRNVGLVYEFLIKCISSSLLEGNKSKAKKATNIIEKRFNNKKELYKEFRLFNALVNSNVTSVEAAAAILYEAKNAFQRIDYNKLEKEKSFLIKEINHSINDKMFYHRRIKDYQLYGSIQKLFNNWSLGDKSCLKESIEYEQKLIQWLVKDKKQIIETNNQKINHSDHHNLVLEIMTKKINTKYKNISKQKKEIIKNYVYLSENHDALRKYLNDVKQSALTELKNFKKTNDNQFLNEKIENVGTKIASLSLSENIDDNKIIKFLTLSDLIDKIKE